MNYICMLLLEKNPALLWQHDVGHPGALCEFLF